jgi:hypothetical protein
MNVRRFLATAAIFLLAGCAVSQEGEDESPLLKLETKIDLLEAMGPPHRVEFDGDDQILSYRCVVGRGLGLGAAFYGAQMAISHHHYSGDVTRYRLGSDGKIKSHDTVRGTRFLEYRLWPFGG